VGEVCHARDSRLNREVAIKSLPAAFAQDKERLARFEREAQVMEVENDRPRPVMEFVTGEEPNFQGRKCPCL